MLNMHAHAWPLYSASKLLGTEFDLDGVRFRPSLPLDEYEFNTALLGFKKTSKGYSGWYAPMIAGHWSIEVALPGIELGRLKHFKVNGVREALHAVGGRIRFSGDSSPGVPLRWEIS